MISPDTRIPRWMRLAFPDDAVQVVKMCEFLVPESQARQDLISYELRKLRHEIWDRNPTSQPKCPRSIRPSKLARISGYRRNHDAKRKF